MNRKTVYGLVAAALMAALPATPGWGFGTVSKVPFLGQAAEHEKITRAALPILDKKTLNELAGESGNFGAVGAPDDPGRTLLMTDEAHCDNGDFLELPPGQTYHQTKEEAKQHLIQCREWMIAHLAAAVRSAGQLAKPDETNMALPCGPFVGTRLGNAKCNVIEELGLAFHASEDFYSHTNWVDKPADGPIEAGNPPGLGQTGRAPWLDPRNETEIPNGLISGCFTFLPETAFCNSLTGPKIIKHADLNKDKGPIVDGVPGIGTTMRGGVDANFARAVNAAIEDTRDKWDYFEEQLRATYGADAETVLCAIYNDDYKNCATPDQPAPMPSAAEIAAATNALNTARKMLADMQSLGQQANTVASQLQQSCAAGQGLGAKLEAGAAAAEPELRALEAAQLTQTAPLNVPAPKAAALAAAGTADTAGKNVARARTIAQKQSEAACKLAQRANAATVDGRTDLNKLLTDAQFAAQQTQAALKMGEGEFARAKAAAAQAQAALAGLSSQANSGADGLRGRLAEMLASANQVADLAVALSQERNAELVPIVESARPLFKQAGERIDAGATGDELEILKQVRQAYVPISDADEALARCAYTMEAIATAVRSRLSDLGTRIAQVAAANAPPAASTRDMASIRNAVADANASLDAAAIFLQPIEGMNDDAQNCLNQARNSANKIVAQRNQASATCTSSYSGSVVNGYKNGAPQCGCPSGWSWNLADNTCITNDARRAEEQRACSNLPGSVFDSVDPADKRAVCVCPEGRAWNDRRNACVAAVANEAGGNEAASDAGQAFGNALANIVTALAQANNASHGGGGSTAPNGFSSPTGQGGAPAVPVDPQDWGVYAIGPANGSPEIVHGSKTAILKRESGSFDGLGRSSETVETLVARGEWKIEEMSRASSYQAAHQQYEALYSKATPSKFWGPFIRINANLINKYNNPEPIGAPR